VEIPQPVWEGGMKSGEVVVPNGLTTEGGLKRMEKSILHKVSKKKQGKTLLIDIEINSGGVPSGAKRLGEEKRECDKLTTSALMWKL